MSQKKITVIAGRELTPDHQAHWARIQQTNAALDSPFFCPEFTLAVAAVRDDVRVGLLQDGGEIVGYFPFQRDWLNSGVPVGAPLSDFQAVVMDEGTSWTAAELVAGCGLTMWQYDHLLASQQPFQQYHRRRGASPFMDLSQGFETYRRTRQQVGTRPFSSLRRLSRKLAREVGTLHVEYHVASPDVLRQLLAWKSNQYRASNGVDILAARKWPARLLAHIHRTQTPHFAGALTALYVNGEVAAAHFGMRSNAILHWWFPAYDPRLARYSPGLILLLAMAESASAWGIRRIDLGKGGEPYKQRFMSGALPLAEGCVSIPCMASILREGLEACWQCLRASRLSYPIRAPGRMVLRLCRSLRGH